MTDHTRRRVHLLISLLVHRLGLSIAEACRNAEAAYVVAQRPDLVAEVRRVKAVLVDGADVGNAMAGDGSSTVTGKVA